MTFGRSNNPYSRIANSKRAKRRDRSLEKWLLQLLALIVCGAIMGYTFFKFVSSEIL